MLRQVPRSRCFTHTIKESISLHQKNRYRRTLWSLAPVAAVGLTVMTGIASVGAYGAFKLNRTRTRWFSDSFVLTPESLRMPYKKIHLKTADDVHLEGWFIEQTVRGKPSDRVVLCCNPYNHDKSTLLAVARALWDTGHSVFLFDFRAFGPKPVPQETIGYLELLDGRAALEWLRQNKPATAKIGIMGCSMGGAVALTLVEENDHEIVGVATDCAFACLRDVVAHYLLQMLPEKLPGKQTISEVLISSLSTCNLFWYGYDLSLVGPFAQLEKLKVPMLIVHSELDSVVPLDQARKIYERASTPEVRKQLIIVPGCEHIGSFFQDEIAYSRRIVSFLDKCFEESAKDENKRSLS